MLRPAHICLSVLAVIALTLGVVAVQTSAVSETFDVRIGPRILRAQVWRPAPVTRLALLKPLTTTGDDEFAVVPFPSCPFPFCPQHCTVPSDNNAQL